MKRFFEELRRRHIFRVAFSYLVVAWLLIQVINNIAGPLELPPWAPTFVIVLVALCFPVALIIAWAFDPAPPREQTGGAGPKTPPVPPLGRKWDFVIIAGLVAALGYALWDRDAVSDQAATAQGGAAEASVAVLPFADISADGDQEYFADGVSEEILNSLARIDGLQVAGRTSSFYFKGRNEDLRTIGEKLNVAHLLEGSVRKAGEQIRITAQLVNAETGYHLWSRTYDRRLADIFAVQDDIAESVARSLEIALGVGALGRQPGMTRDVAAYDAFLEGTRPQEGESTLEGYRRQADALERAVELDPSFAVAWAELAGAYESVWGFDDPGNAAEWRRRAEDARARARELAPEAPQVMPQSARAAGNRQAWLEADRLYRRALELHGDAARTNDFGWFLLAMGKADAAVAELTAARRADPLSPTIAFVLGKAHAAVGELQEALADFEQAEALGGSPAQVRGAAMIVALAMADRAEIARRLERSTAVTSGIGVDVNTAMRERLDDPEAALAELRRLREDTDDLSAIGEIVIAQWAAHFGDAELALTLVEEALPPGIEASVGALTVLWDPLMSEMRALPAFKDYVRDLGLVEYWRETGWGDFCRPVGENDFACE